MVNKIALTGKNIAIPESRQLDQLSTLLEDQGANIIRCPLVSINDAPDTAPVVTWLRAFAANPPAFLVLFTGEGLTRLLAIAETAKIQMPFVDALSRTPLICRGKKPVRVLRHLSLRPTFIAKPATTDGVIDTLESLPIDGSRVGVQLYGTNPNEKLMSYLASRAVQIESVAPYVYANDLDDQHTVDLIRSLAAGFVDLIAFTSSSQVERLLRVANKFECHDKLITGLRRTAVAAVGPVVQQSLERQGITVSIAPDKHYFMQTMVQKIIATVNAEQSN